MNKIDKEKLVSRPGRSRPDWLVRSRALPGLGSSAVTTATVELYMRPSFTMNEYSGCVNSGGF